jgi:peptidoglycan endopeptidase LytE
MIDKEIEKVELGANEVENAVPVDEVSPFNLDVKKKPSITPVISETIEPVVTESDDLEYVVQPGDSLLLIARKILLDPKKYKDIVKWNDLKSEVLYPNQKLILKGVSEAKKSEFKRLNTDDRSLLYSPDEYYYMIYKVQSGDSLSRIAKKLLGSHNEYFKLAKFNGLNPDKFLYIGQKLVIPIKK